MDVLSPPAKLAMPLLSALGLCAALLVSCSPSEGARDGPQDTIPVGQLGQALFQAENNLASAEQTYLAMAPPADASDATSLGTLSRETWLTWANDGQRLLDELTSAYEEHAEVTRAIETRIAPQSFELATGYPLPLLLDFSEAYGEWLATQREQVTQTRVCLELLPNESEAADCYVELLLANGPAWQRSADRINDVRAKLAQQLSGG